MKNIKKRNGDKLWIVVSDFGKSDTHRVYYNKGSLLKGIRYLKEVEIFEYNLSNSSSHTSGKEYIEYINKSKIRDIALDSILGEEKEKLEDNDINIVLKYMLNLKVNIQIVGVFESLRYDKDLFIKELKKSKYQRFVKYNVANEVDYYISLFNLLGKRTKIEYDFISNERIENINKALELVSK